MYRSAVLALVVGSFLTSGSFAAPNAEPLDEVTTLEGALSAWDVQSLGNLEPDAQGTLTPFVELNGVEHVLVLEPHSLRNEQFQVWVQDEEGKLVPHAAPAPLTYRGVVANLPGSRVRASLIDGQLTARVQLTPDQVWMVEPLSTYEDLAEAAEHVVYSGEAVLPTGHGCGNDQLDQPRHGHLDLRGHDAGTSEAINAPRPFQSGDEADKTVEIACDTDYEFYQKNGSSVSATIADIENVLNGVDDIYQSDVEICYNITHLIIRNTSNDPYTSNDAATLLGQFEDHWRAEHYDLRRDVAHMFTGRNLNGGTIGIAYLTSICKSSTGYGLVESRYTSNYAHRVSLSAHELGHNWSAVHCCGGCYGCPTCHIMCPCNAGCSGIVTRFGDDSIASITQHRNSRGCLDDGCGPEIDLTHPTPGEAGSTNTLSVRGVTPNGIVGILYSLQLGNWEAQPYCPNVYLGLNSPTLLGVVTANSNGIATLAVNVPGNARNVTVHFQAGDVSTCAVSDIVSHTFQ